MGVRRRSVADGRAATGPPTATPGIRTAGVAAIGAVVLSTAAIVAVPTVAPFVVTLAVLLAVYATVHAGRSTPHTTTASYRTVTFIAVAGITAVITALWAVAVAHPSATTDHAHILSTLLAVALTGYLASALHRPTAHADPIRYSATAGAICLAGVTAFTAVTGSDLAAYQPDAVPGGNRRMPHRRDRRGRRDRRRRGRTPCRAAHRHPGRAAAVRNRHDQPAHGPQVVADQRLRSEPPTPAAATRMWPAT